MLFKNTLAVLSMALSVTAVVADATDEQAAMVQRRFFQLDLGYQKATALLDQLSSTEQSDASLTDAIVDQYTKTATIETQDVEEEPQPQEVFENSTQLVICSNFHSLVTTGFTLQEALFKHADAFSKSQRDTLQDTFTSVNDETSRFQMNVAATALPLCQETIAADVRMFTESLVKTVRALDPAKAAESGA